jgi:hypothetical protein
LRSLVTHFVRDEGSQVQILPLRPAFSQSPLIRGLIWGTKPEARSCPPFTQITIAFPRETARGFRHLRERLDGQVRPRAPWRRVHRRPGLAVYSEQPTHFERIDGAIRRADADRGSLRRAWPPLRCLCVAARARPRRGRWPRHQGVMPSETLAAQYLLRAHALHRHDLFEGANESSICFGPIAINDGSRTINLRMAGPPSRAGSRGQCAPRSQVRDSSSPGAGRFPLPVADPLRQMGVSPIRGWNRVKGPPSRPVPTGPHIKIGPGETNLRVVP